MKLYIILFAVVVLFGNNLLYNAGEFKTLISVLACIVLASAVVRELR